MNILPWTRTYNYIQDYYNTVYNYYAQCYPAYPVTYYSLDHDNTVWEDTNLKGGSYEWRGVGPLSGVKWRKILLFPIFTMDAIVPNYDSDQKGYTLKETIRTNIAFPSIYGLHPTPDDKIDLSFAFNNDIRNSVRTIFDVNNINLSHVGEYFQMYQCVLKISGKTKALLEQQISSYWMFYEHEKAILPLENAKILMKIQEQSITDAKLIENNIFQKHCGFFLYDNSTIENPNHNYVPEPIQPELPIIPEFPVIPVSRDSYETINEFRDAIVEHMETLDDITTEEGKVRIDKLDADGAEEKDVLEFTGEKWDNTDTIHGGTF